MKIEKNGLTFSEGPQCSLSIYTSPGRFLETRNNSNFFKISI